MKKIFLVASLAIFLTAGMMAIPSATKAESLGAKLSGRILLAVQANGEAWYINPVNQQRYFLGRPSDAFNLMRQLGLGISNKDFNSFNGKAPIRLSGRILLKVEDLGKAYYINPLDLKLYFLGRPLDAFNLMRELSLGITNLNLDTIPVFANKSVNITNYSFNPANLIINKGAMVTWTNNDSVAHTVNSPGNFDFGNIDSGKSYSRIFNTIGVYSYHCTSHPYMTGTITVE
jgi:plastocyanin